MHESTKHPQRGRRPESIDRFPEIHCSGIPDSMPFHEKCVARPQKSFRIDPFFKRGRRVQGRVLRKVPKQGWRSVSIDRFPKIYGSGIPDSSPFHKKYVARPQIKFSDRPLFQKGSPGAGRGPAKSIKREPERKNEQEKQKPRAVQSSTAQPSFLCKNTERILNPLRSYWL